MCVPYGFCADDPAAISFWCEDIGFGEGNYFCDEMVCDTGDLIACEVI
jgi:hypothetical protein